MKLLAGSTPCSVRRRSFPAADSTLPPPARVNVGIVVHSMKAAPTQPCSLGDRARCVTTQPIFVTGHGFHMRDIDARWSATQMVKHESVWKRSDEMLVHDAVRGSVGFGRAHEGIPVLVQGEGTDQAISLKRPRCGHDSGHNSQCGRDRLSHIGTSIPVSSPALISAGSNHILSERGDRD